MADNLKMFQRLGYASVIVDLLGLLFLRGSGLSTGDIAAITIISIAVSLIVAWLIWAAARGRKWAGWLLFLALVFSALSNLGDFWSGGPAWFQYVFGPDPSATTASKAVDLVSTLLLAAALYFYFLAAPALDAASPTARS